MLAFLAAFQLGMIIGTLAGIYGYKFYLRKLHKLAIRIRKIQRGGR